MKSWIRLDGLKADIHSFPTMFEMGQNSDFLQTSFLRDTNLHQLTWEQSGTPYFKSLTSFNKFLDTLSDLRLLKFSGTSNNAKSGDVLLLSKLLFDVAAHRVPPTPCESWRPEDLENPFYMGVERSWTGVIAGQSWRNVKFWVRVLGVFSTERLMLPC